MKKVLSALVVLAMSAVLSGCLFGKKEEAPVEQAPSATEAPAPSEEVPSEEAPADMAPEQAPADESGE